MGGGSWGDREGQTEREEERRERRERRKREPCLTGETNPLTSEEAGYSYNAMDES